MIPRRIAITLTSDGSGNVSTFSDQIVNGRVAQIRYDNGGGTPFTGTPAFTVTSATAGEAIWSETVATTSLSRAPRQGTHSTVGTALLYAAGGAAVSDLIAVANDRIKVVVSGAGATKTATLHVLLV